MQTMAFKIVERNRGKAMLVVENYKFSFQEKMVVRGERLCFWISITFFREPGSQVACTTGD